MKNTIFYVMVCALYSVIFYPLSHAAAGAPAGLAYINDLQKNIPQELLNRKLQEGNGRVGISFRELLNGISYSIDAKDKTLYNALLNAIKPVLASDELLQKEFNKVSALDQFIFKIEYEATRSGKMEVDPRFATPIEKANILWPLMVWAVENDHLELFHALSRNIDMNDKKPYGRRVSVTEMARFLNSPRIVQSIEKYLSVPSSFGEARARRG